MIFLPKLFGQIRTRSVKAMVYTKQLHFPTAEVVEEAEAPKAAALDLMKLEEEPAVLWTPGGFPGESIRDGHRITESHLPPSFSLLFASLPSLLLFSLLSLLFLCSS